MKDYERFHFFLIGTGATGSQLIPMLTQLLNNTKHKRITLIDGDIVEEKNLKNQKFLEKDIGFYKSQVLAERYQRVYPELDIKYIPEYIKDIDLIVNIIGQIPLDFIPVIISCVDNIETRKVICEFIKKSEATFNKQYKYIYIDSGNGTDDRNGQIIISTNISELGNFTKLPWDICPEIKEATQTVDSALSCGNQVDKHPQNIATNICAATSLFMVLTNLIMFNRINSNFIKFDADNIDTVSRSIN